MLIDLNWWECNKILRLLKDSHNNGVTYSGDDELEMKIASHRNSIVADRLWQQHGHALSDMHEKRRDVTP